jgi:hypothetical protein
VTKTFTIELTGELEDYDLKSERVWDALCKEFPYARMSEIIVEEITDEEGCDSSGR